MKRNVNLLISILLVFTGMLFFNIDKAFAQEAGAYCTYYLNDSKTKLYYYNDVYIDPSSAGSYGYQNYGWKNDFKIVIYLKGNYNAGSGISKVNYTADCWEWLNGDWQKGTCELPDVSHVDKTKFVGGNYKFKCPDLHVNGVFYHGPNDGSKYILDFTANVNYKPLRTQMGTPKFVAVNKSQSKTTIDTSGDDWKGVEEYLKQLKGSTSDTIDYSGGVQQGKADCAMFEDGNGNQGEFLKKLKIIFNVMRIAGIVLCIVLTMLEFAQAVTSAEPEKMKKAGSNAIKRIIAVVVLILLPVIIDFILTILHSAGFTEIGGWCIDQFKFSNN